MAQLPRMLRFGTHLAQGARRLAVDSALGGRRSFPRTVGDLTAENLSAITGRRITGAALLDEEPGTSTHARLALTGDDVPGSVFVKMSAGSIGIRMLGELAGLGRPRRASTATWHPIWAIAPCRARTAPGSIR